MTKAMYEVTKPILRRIPLLRKVRSLFDERRNRAVERNILADQGRVRERIARQRSANEKTKIYFVFTQSQLWGLQAFYDLLWESEDFDPYVVVMPNTEDSSTPHRVSLAKNLAEFGRLGVRIISGATDDGTIASCTTIITDGSIVFVDQPHPGLPGDWSYEQLSKRSLICYVPYGFKVANAHDGHFNQLLHNIAWRVFCETDWHKAQFAKYGKRDAANIVVSGYPKFDEYRRSDKTAGLDPKVVGALEAGKKIVIWAPHWSVQDDYLGYSTFDRYYRDFQRLAASRPELMWIFRPHQRLRYHLEEIGFLPAIEIEKYYEWWCHQDNTACSTESNYINMFRASSAMITDSGSFLAEYLPSAKPVLVLRSKGSVGYNELGEAIIASYHHADTAEGIERFVSDVVLNGNDALIAQRNGLSRLIFNQEIESSSRILISELRSSLSSSEVRCSRWL
ncbi:CDP-glycerol glycerophosphotransferase family protein [Sphingomonas sp. Root710]|uniref:CDP-glycerol glycerophosphotransferase family protein n=1 Tax=Sphingomonas sp. Root710 TaxID=1736594 RepID=UPI00138F6087|nr:CDP-glycerol glycerophosphotransferase family protein [Sphingomonas sp. Root710]